jgi:transcriptional regulator with XRE-family HTH domain
MLSQIDRAVPDETRALRLEMGKWLRTLRETGGLSQRDLATALGLDYYTFISQLENGRGRIPPARYAEWADALGVDRKLFVEKVLYFTEPHTYEILFGEAG